MMTKISEKSYANVGISMPKLLLHVEGLVVLLLVGAYYAYQGYSWLLFVLLLLAPDLAMLGYMVSKDIGSVTYNVVHTYTLPAILAVISLAAGFELGLPLALIWFAHIGMDRMVGYGLKYPGDSKDTHLSRV